MLGEAEVRRLEEVTNTEGTIAQKEADRLIALAEKEAAEHAASLAKLEARKAECGAESEAAQQAQAELEALEAQMAAASFTQVWPRIFKRIALILQISISVVVCRRPSSRWRRRASGRNRRPRCSRRRRPSTSTRTPR